MLLDTNYDAESRTFTGHISGFREGFPIFYKFLFSEDFCEIASGDRSDKDRDNNEISYKKFGRGEELEYNIDKELYAKWQKDQE